MSQFTLFVRSNDPGTPDTGKKTYYVKNGALHSKDDLGVVRDLETIMGNQRQFFNADFNANVGNFPTLNVATNGAARFYFHIPDTFTSLVEVKLLAIPGGTNAAVDIDLSSDYAKPGEPFNNHSESNTTITYNFTANEIVEMDVSSVFSTLEAGDNCGLHIQHNSVSGGVDYLGIKLVYG